MEQKKKEEENIFMFVPNLIGYARIFLALLSFWFMPTNHVVAGWCYILSGLLDAFDGHAARAFNQSTKFGAMLDMLTDRCATMCLLATLGTFYPRWLFFFQLSMTIDMSCHWIHLHTSTLQVSDAVHGSHCSKSSFFVQKFNFDFPRKLSIFWGVKNSRKCCGSGLFSR